MLYKPIVSLCKSNIYLFKLQNTTCDVSNRLHFQLEWNGNRIITFSDNWEIADALRYERGRVSAKFVEITRYTRFREEWTNEGNTTQENSQSGHIYKFSAGFHVKLLQSRVHCRDVRIRNPNQFEYIHCSYRGQYSIYK